jgi:GAF domain-containing protein
MAERGATMEDNFLDSSFFALNRVIDVIYQDEEDLSDILYFVVSLASEITAAKGSTIRVLEHGTFDLKVVSSYGLSAEYLESGAIDYGKSVTEIMQGDIIIINDFENDSRIQNGLAAIKEDVHSVIGIPFTVNETTYSILRTYFSFRKVPTQDEIAFLNSLGKLSCLAIERTAVRSGLV